MKRKTHFLTFIITLLCLSCVPEAFAKGGGNGGGNGMGGMGRGGAPSPSVRPKLLQSGTASDLQHLRSFLELDDRQLASIIATLQKIQTMNPDQKQALKARIEQFSQLPEPTREYIREGWTHHSERDRDRWQQMMHSLPSEEQQSIRNTMQRTPFEDKAAQRLRILEEWQSTKGSKSGAEIAKPE